MPTYQLNINGDDIAVDTPADTPLLWVLRDQLDLTGTKYSCGIGACGACTVLLNGHTNKSCRTPISEAAGYNIITIEGLSRDASHPVQKAFIAEDVPQCGYCQSGQVLAAAALLDSTAQPTDNEINAAMRNVCRCGTYARIRSAIKRVSRERANT